MIPTRWTGFLVLCMVGVLLAMGMTGCSGNVSEAATVRDEVTLAPKQNEETDKTSTLPDTPEPTAADAESAKVARPEGWSEETHSDDADPNYAVVFPQDQVNQIKITIAPEDWKAMQANMVELFGEAGSGEAGRGFRGGFEPPDGDRPQPGEEGFPEGFEPPEGGRPQPGEEGFPEGFEPPEDGDRPAQPGGDPFGGRPGGGAFGGGDITPENPTWVPATIEFEGTTWTNVGVRYKGNSSLTSGWRSGTLKLPLKLDFDEFEDDYPEIDDQRFYGFKQLSLANGFSDASFLRDTATYAILEEAGLPAAKTAFYEVILDYGKGPVTLGLYTMIEVVDDTVIERYFGSDDGNIYEAEGSAASFATSTYDQIEQSFLKENNQDEADWSDIEALFDVLHSEQRTTDPATWRTNLESVFDVDGFLEWLAISAVIQHWDAYGNMSHNYYLYHDPDTGRLTWISWDHNMAMSSGMGGGGERDPGGRNVSLDKADVGDNWPLIHYLLDDPVYYELYVDYLAETVEGPFNPDHMAETYQTLAELIAPYAAADVGEAAFDAAVQQLIEHAYKQTDAVEAFLASIGR
jgi:spore coat protein H